MQVSSREKNRLKRKAKMEAKAAAKMQDEERATEAKKTKLETVLVSQPESNAMVVDSVEVEVDFESSGKWPLQEFCNQLALDLFSEEWEARHGAATGLRELLKGHGSAGGRVAGVTGEEGEGLHQAWLEDLVLRLLCVLALDRFGDFVSDAVVAPVRESAAQALGVALPFLPDNTVLKVANLVLGLVRQEDWEARHGGLLAAKYLLAVRTDLATQLLESLYPQIFSGLTDSADDVVAVAASALLPVVSSLVSKLPGELACLAEQLWEQLAEPDDLTSSTQSVMALLAELLAQEGGLALCLLSTDSLSTLVPRLYPFLSHSSSMVRQASLSTVLTLSSAPALAPAWLPACAPLLLRHLYCRALLEHQGSILILLEKTWATVLHQAPLQPLLMAACPWFGPWLQLLATRGHNALDHTLFPPGIPGSRHFLGGSDAQSLPDPHARAAAVARARHTGARLMGLLAAYIVQPVPGDPGSGETPLEMLLSKVLVPQLQTDWAHQHTAVAMLVRAWLEGEKSTLSGLSSTALPSALLICLVREAPYAELTVAHARLAEEAGDFVASLRHFGLPVASLGLPPPPLSLPAVQELVSSQTDQLLSQARLSSRNLTTLHERHSSLASTLETVLQEQDSMQLATLATLAGALAALGPKAFPAKLNPVLKPLMEAVKREVGEELQRMAACSLARVLDACIDRQPCPNDKVVKNLCSFVCSNPEVVPLVDLAHLHGAVDPQLGILTLHYSERRAEQANRTRRGRKKKNGVVGLETGPAPLQTTTDIDNEEEVARAEVQRRGTTEALRQIAKFFGQDLPKKVPMVYQMSLYAVANLPFNGDMQQHQELVNALEVVRVVTPYLHSSLLPELEQLIPRLLDITSLPLTAARFMAARLLATIAKVSTVTVMTAVITHLLPGISDPHSVSRKAGAMETLYCLCDELGLDLVPYIVLLIVPVLGAMSDADTQVRLLATNTFATLVRLLPLDGGTKEPEGLSEELRRKKEREKGFLSQLLDNRKAEEFRISVPVKAELRSYQVAGVNWLAFLARYRLHGVLCDDMGLGKTLQTICVVASDHRDRSAEGETSLQSLVICPATLGGHWLEEVTKFVSAEHLQPFLYFGPPHVRVGLRSQLARHNLIITSYDIIRNDVELISNIKWNYLVLDEGHVIKNTKTKTAIAIRQLVARHRLILTGTPIQNSVNELWALFDFLMPGYLGSERSFGVKYGRPILASREARCGARDQEAGALAMEALHRQTLPFILRRMKEEVLADLPPKITQDYYCNLSPLQTQLYEDFTRAQGRAAQDGQESAASTHVFQALQYLRKVCCHPKLVLSPDHPEYKTVLADHLNGDIKGLLDINHAAKLVALKQLLVDLGMGQNHDEVVGQHRALVFCQLKSMMDIVETDLLKVSEGVKNIFMESLHKLFHIFSDKKLKIKMAQNLGRFFSSTSMQNVWDGFRENVFDTFPKCPAKLW